MMSWGLTARTVGVSGESRRSGADLPDGGVRDVSPMTDRAAAELLGKALG
jgi:hypothetical protein